MQATDKIYYAIGLMSGSSLDGLDLAYCTFTLKKSWSFKLIKAKNSSLGSWEQKLRKARGLNTEELDALSIEFAHYLAQEVKLFIRENEIEKIDLVVSHGHTIYHYPEVMLTCQIGDGQTIANLLGIKVVNNLRQADLYAGGQGAPIVPIGDLLLFPQYPVCLNIGGIANFSIKTKTSIIAYDVCVANQVLNHYAKKYGCDYDDRGNIARIGVVNVKLLMELHKQEYYKAFAPKSLDNGMTQNLIEIIDRNESVIENVLATFVEHISIEFITAIFETMLVHRIPFEGGSPVLVTGGGAYNDFLLERIRANVKLDFVVPEDEIIEFKEAIVMAFIGVLKIRNEVNVLASVTGAMNDTSCGEIFEKV